MSSIVEQLPAFELMADMIWRPIKTAPKDGTQILLVIAGFEPLCGRWRRRKDGYEGWTSDPDEARHDPTHWLPLPTSPLPSPKGEGAA